MTRPILVAAALCASLTGQTPSLLRDVNANPPPEPSAWPAETVEFQGRVYFEAATPLTGRALFRTDGTASGTTLVHEFVPGPDDASVHGLTAIGNRLHFGVDDGVHGEEPWISDGSPQGTRLLLDIVPGPGSGMASGFTGFAGRVYFRARDSNGIELWTTDGTAAGTQPFVDIRPGTDSSLPELLTVVGSRLFFVANDGVHGAEPWVTDGTRAGTHLLLDVYPGSTESGAEPLGQIGGRLVFRAYNGAHALWTTDGTTAGTQPIPSALTGVRYTRAVLGNALLFAGYDPAFGEELWRTDGTTAGTRRVRDIHPGSASSQLRLLGVVGTRALLTVDPYRQDGLWVTDGTAAGTTQVMPLDVWPGTGIELGGALLFRADDPSHGEELWRSDGTAAGTFMVADAWPGPQGSVPGIWTHLGATHVVYAARDDLGGEPWITDGTAAGTRRIVNLGANPHGWTGSSAPRDSVDWSGTLALSAITTEEEPWLSDGTSAGTRPYHTFPGARPFAQLNEDGNPRLHVCRGRLVSLVGNYPSWDLWLDDGSGPALGSPIVLNGSSHPLGRWAAGGGYLWFASDELWRVEGANAIRWRLAPGRPLQASDLIRVGASVACPAHDGTSYGVFRADGGGVVRLTTLQNGPPWQLTAVQDRLYFVAQEASTGTELWVSDGTPAGTRALDLVPGSQGVMPYVFAAYDDALLFFADDGQHDWEIWSTRGSVGSTTRWTDLPDGIAPWSITAHRLGLDRFVFVLDAPHIGRELWTLTPAGASLVVDLVPGAEGSNPRILGVAGEELYFLTDRPRAGLWRSDGTAAGTRMLMAGIDDARWFDVVGGQVFFDHDDGVLGREPWTVTAGATTRSIGEPCGDGFRTPWIEASDPVLGSHWRVRGGGGAVGSAGILLLGFPAARPYLLPGGCTSYVDAPTANVLLTTPDAASTWHRHLTIPNVPALVGAQLVAQAWAGPSPNAFGIDSSNALWLSLDTW